MLTFVLAIGCEQGPPVELARAGGAAAAVERARQRVMENHAYERLASANARLVVGHTCYYGAKPPQGWAEFNVLVRARRDDLLWRLQRASTPEARLYGAIGLRETEAVGPKWFTVLVTAISEPVATCSGCEFSSGPATEAVAAYDGWESA